MVKILAIAADEKLPGGGTNITISRQGDGYIGEYWQLAFPPGHSLHCVEKFRTLETAKVASIEEAEARGIPFVLIQDDMPLSI